MTNVRQGPSACNAGRRSGYAFRSAKTAFKE